MVLRSSFRSIMKFLLCVCIAFACSVATAFQPSSSFSARLGETAPDPHVAIQAADSQPAGTTTRPEFFQAVAVGSVAAVGLLPRVASARGFATLEQAYERYSPRIRAGGEFYRKDLKVLVAKNDWAGIQNALQEPPKRRKEDLTKADAGVAARARQAGEFSDARVLVAADLYAAAFSDNSISAKTKRMKEAVEKMRNVVAKMQSIARQGLGKETQGGIFGISAKKVPEAELAKQIRELYVEGGNSWNEFVFAANENMPLQFDRLEYVK